MKNGEAGQIAGAVVAGLFVIGGFGYLAWDSARVLTPEDISSAPSGCIADTLRQEVERATQPLTTTSYASIKSRCEEWSNEQRRFEKASQALKQQKDAYDKR